jgi:hypothetical protein
MSTPPRSLPSIAAFLLLMLTALPCGAGEDWRNEPAFKDLQKAEAKLLQGLLRTAVKEDYRRQAWYLADRLLAADPANDKGLEILETWSEAELQQGSDVKKAFRKKRDSALRGLGDDWFHFGEKLEAAGIDPVDYYPVNQRAQAYGSKAGPLMAALQAGGYMWMGTFLDREIEKVQKILGPARMGEIGFPPEFDDHFLRYRVRWPDTQIATFGRWRLITDVSWDKALAHIALVMDLEEWTEANIGKLVPMEEPEDLAVFRDMERFDKNGSRFVREEDREDFAKRSTWYSRWRRRCLIGSQERGNDWVAGETLIKGRVGYILARKAMVKGAGGGIRGRGTWLLDGIQGAYEGLQRSEDARGGFELDPSRCWRLAVARALRDTGGLLPWPSFLELDQQAARDVPRATVMVKIGGVEREAKDIDVVAAQATALVVGIMKSDPKKGPKAVAKLVQELIKRDSLPDIPKTLRWKKGRLKEEVDKAMEAAHGK